MAIHRRRLAHREVAAEINFGSSYSLAQTFPSEVHLTSTTKLNSRKLKPFPNTLFRLRRGNRNALNHQAIFSSEDVRSSKNCLHAPIIPVSSNFLAFYLMRRLDETLVKWNGDPWCREVV